MAKSSPIPLLKIKSKFILRRLLTLSGDLRLPTPNIRRSTFQTLLTERWNVVTLPSRECGTTFVSPVILLRCYQTHALQMKTCFGKRLTSAYQT